ncbi:MULTISPECIES: glycosyltransferase [Mangrovimonas]|uniref:glycosyltransferase n=1 Tax=Mangrovimonas TaxID=1211036 RepID=UPI0006B62B3D|nr:MULTISPECIES: glycosyltransferase [Mangrovimonas]OMP31772.1 hypothetical protein BKM32_01545 [Mangrovimonas sp. DI 80]
MAFNILHLIDSVDQVNFGIWNAALTNSGFLGELGIVSYAAIPKNDSFNYPAVNKLEATEFKSLRMLMGQKGLIPENTIVVSHGCWRWPTRLGGKLKSEGYKWIAVPHGMLEPWSMQQKAIKKKIYWNLIEKQRLLQADVIRAVGTPEALNLKSIFDNKVCLIPNGVPNSNRNEEKGNDKIRFLFMARLHHKKGIVPLVKGWMKSSLANSQNHELLIAGPDDGELNVLNDWISKSKNIHYLGGVYGEEKEGLLKKSHVYVLPSYSEGFPTSVLEAMMYGLMPLISEGCNFPEVFDKDLAMSLEPEEIMVKMVLDEVEQLSLEEIKSQGRKCREFVIENYTNEKIGNQLEKLYRSLLDGNEQLKNK